VAGDAAARALGHARRDFGALLGCGEGCARNCWARERWAKGGSTGEGARWVVRKLCCGEGWTFFCFPFYFLLLFFYLFLFKFRYSF
jgi:hypothetical protein